MCGIVGAIAQRNVTPILLEGLHRLEYRGYDSVGIAVINNQHMLRMRSTERVAHLKARAKEGQFTGLVGIGHTRWATHGAPSETNAHPHFSQDDLISVVHNGIIENYEPLRERLKAAGYTFVSDTDTEVITHLIHQYFLQEKNLFNATRAAISELKGAYAIGVMCASQPDTLVCTRHGSPLVLGLGIEENFFASDVSALLPVTHRIIYLEEGDIAEVTLTQIRIVDREGQLQSREEQKSEQGADAAELGQYRHYMQKEIFEQPHVVADTLEAALSYGLRPELFGENAATLLPHVKAVNILACGTSYHAGLVARYWIESIAKLPCQVEIASEYRYRDSVSNPDTLIVVISQSGETADTLAALKHAKSLGHDKTLAICNVAQSALVRATNMRFLTLAGQEIGVASTKAFTTQLVGLFILANTLAKLQGQLSAADEATYIAALRALPQQLDQVLALETVIEVWAKKLEYVHNTLFIGRHVMYPISLEGALKLKEISYIHAEAYAAGELKHGPLALVDKAMPVIALVPNDGLIDKCKSNLQEVAARGGDLLVLTDADLPDQPGMHIIHLPGTCGILAPIIFTLPLQLLAYHTALNKGTDVDKPRNLAKSVTVE
jgi:glucosamine--fructose-6-phosphate aminotransferase (isomerizing)